MDVSAAFDRARDALRGEPRERLGEWVVPRRVLGFSRAPRLLVRGTAWRLGVFLIDDGHVYSVGDVVRAADPGRRGYTAEASRERAAVAAEALRAGVPDGEVLHIAWAPIDLDEVADGGDSAPLEWGENGLGVRWSRSGGLAPLERYLTEQLALRG